MHHSSSLLSDRSVLAGLAAGALALSCSSVGGVDAKQCRPGCVDGATRLVCDSETEGRAEACPSSGCARGICHDGACGVEPDVGKVCGATELGTCNEGYACIGPDTSLTALLRQTCAVDDEGKVFCWGENTFRQLGDGTQEFRANPVPVQGLPGPASMASAGYHHVCAVLSTGDVYCWGRNDRGQCGGAPAESLQVPSKVELPAGVRATAVTAGEAHSCALTDAGAVYCWGRTAEGECGVLPSELGGATLVGPRLVAGLDDVQKVETVKNHTCVLRSAQPRMMCWGSNNVVFQGQSLPVFKLGPEAGTTSLDAVLFSAVPLPVFLGSEVADIGMGYDTTYALDADGSAYAWGLNDRKQSGTGVEGLSVPEPLPVLVAADPGTDVRQTDEPTPLTQALDILRSDGSDMCVEMERRTHYQAAYLCWGGNERGEVGTGDPAHDDVEFPHAMVAKVIPMSARGLVHGENHACAVASESGDYEVLCFGMEPYVGNGTPLSPTNAPTETQWNALPVVWDRVLVESVVGTTE